MQTETTTARFLNKIALAFKNKHGIQGFVKAEPCNRFKEKGTEYRLFKIIQNGKEIGNYHHFEPHWRCLQTEYNADLSDIKTYRLIRI